MENEYQGGRIEFSIGDLVDDLSTIPKDEPIAFERITVNNVSGSIDDPTIKGRIHTLENALLVKVDGEIKKSGDQSFYLVEVVNIYYDDGVPVFVRTGNIYAVNTGYTVTGHLLDWKVDTFFDREAKKTPNLVKFLEDIKPGDSFLIPAGHIVWGVQGKEMVGLTNVSAELVDGNFYISVLVVNRVTRIYVTRKAIINNSTVYILTHQRVMSS